MAWTRLKVIVYSYSLIPKPKYIRATGSGVLKVAFRCIYFWVGLLGAGHVAQNSEFRQGRDGQKSSAWTYWVSTL